MALRGLFIDGKISNPATGNSIDLLVMGEETLPYLESIEISMEHGANLNMSVTLSPPYEQALELLSKDNEWLRLGNTIGIRWGYSDLAGAISDWHYGFMQMPEVSFGEQISITIQATTLAWNADRVERLRDWCATTPKSFRDVVTEITKRYDLVAEFGNLDPVSTALIDEPVESMVQGGKTDLHFMKYKAMEYGLEMIVKNQNVYFLSPGEPLPGSPNVNATFQMYGRIDLANGIYPMTSIDPESMGAMFIKNFQGVNALAYGPNDDPAVKKEPVVATDKTAPGAALTSKETVSNPPSDDGKPPQDMDDVKVKSTVRVDPAMDEGGRMFCIPLNGSESEDFINGILSGVREASASEHGVRVSFGSIAVPNLFPRMMVRLDGVGDYFTGSYMLNKVNIRIDSGGAEMECEAFGRGFAGVNPDVDPLASTLDTFVEPVDDSANEALTTEEVSPS